MSDYVEEEEKESFPAWIKRVFFTYCFRLIGLNAVFLLCCVPVVTIPAALCGMYAVLQGYYRNIYSTEVIRTFFKEFFSSFFVRTALVWGLALGAVALAAIAGMVFPYPIWMAVSALLFVILLLVVSWFLHQTVLLNISCKHALRNAFLLVGIETKVNFILICVHAVCLTVLLFGLPVTGFLLIVLPVVFAVVATGVIMPVLQHRLVQSQQ